MVAESVIVAVAAVAVAGSLLSLAKRYLEARSEAERQVKEWEQPTTTPVSVSVELRWNVRSQEGDYEDRNGKRATIEFDPTDAESIHSFLNTIRQEELAGKGGVRGLAAPTG